MFSTNTFVALLAFAALFLVRADVVPTIPAPGSVYNEGSTCIIAWDGDTSSTTLWKNMSIEMMSGDNFNMVFITTVATGQDGSVNGQFSYPCPQVSPNSAIYFYEFNAPSALNQTWTGRFAIASSSGKTTPPTNSIQPDNSTIPWGIGGLVNPSDIVPPPPFVAAIFAASNTTSYVASSSSTTGSASSVLTTVVTSASSLIPSASATTSTTGTSGAMTGFNIRVLGVAAAAAATLAFSFVW